METEDWSGGSSDLEVASLVSDNEYDLGDSPKLQHRKNVTRAYWDEALGMAEIVSIKGPRWRTTGIVRDGKIYAFLEDALFLAEIGALHLLDDKDECIPLKDIYMKIAQGIGGLSWESFEVYKHLKSLGYIVKRHGVCWTLKHAKRVPASVEGEPGSQRIIDTSSITEITELFRSVKIKDEVRPFFDVYPPNSMFKKSSPGDPMFILCINHGNPSTKEQIEDLERQCEGIPLLFCYVEHGRVELKKCSKPTKTLGKRSLIKNHLLIHLPLGIALRQVLDALRKPVDSKMYGFGITALEQFTERLKEWPMYCKHILDISHLCVTHSELVSFVEITLAGDTSHSLPANQHDSPV